MERAFAEHGPVAALRDPALEPGERELFTVRQSAAVHVLGASLGIASSLLLLAVGRAPEAAVVGVVTALWGVFLVATRTRCIVTDRRIVRQGLLRAASVDLRDVRRVHLGRDRLRHSLLVVEHTGGRLVVRDLSDPEGIVPVVESLARDARRGGR